MRDDGHGTAQRSPRYIVTELRGYLSDHQSGGVPGTSYHVIDAPWNRRLIATFRTEDYRTASRLTARDQARFRAEEMADALNAGQRPRRLTSWRLRRRIPCPSCGDLLSETLTRCVACGTRVR